MAKKTDDFPTNPNKTVVTVVTHNPTDRDEKRQACLVTIYGGDLGRRIPLGSDGPLIIGRSSRADLQIDQESVSRNHCEIVGDNNRYLIRDLGSTNGTYVNDELVEEASLRDGDQIKIGRTIMKFITSGNIEAQYHEEIYRLMTIDGLTQVHNKRYFEELLEREVSRSVRYDRQFCVVMADIDHFKEINDTHGHLAGDAILRQIGRLLQNRVRRDDIVARMGGEEFAILLPEVDLENAQELAESIRSMIESTTFRFEQEVIPVTMSLGVAQWSEGMTSGEQLVKAADIKLYEAKNSGRNKVAM